MFLSPHGTRRARSGMALDAMNDPTALHRRSAGVRQHPGVSQLWALKAHVFPVPKQQCKHAAVQTYSNATRLAACVFHRTMVLMTFGGCI